ncbi:MAG: glycosyltransferase [Cyanobacteria bacterium P01_A01_bin.45]
MRISACITTRNRTQHLEACLQALWNSQVKPFSVVVSDDSPDVEVQQQNQDVVNKYPGTVYIQGPQTGVCGNRNNAVNATKDSETEFVAFVDDDILVEPDFLACAVEKYQQLSPEERNNTILSGVSKFNDEDALVPAKLSFQGHFLPSDAPETVVIHAALFPRKFFTQEQWDENIYFGYEDAELCLRAIKRGYKIISCPGMVVKSSITQSSTLDAPGIGGISNYQLHIEAARLYVGIKRYKNVFPNPLKLIAFVAVYFTQMSAYLFKNGAIQAWPEIIRRARLGTLLQLSSI